MERPKLLLINKFYHDVGAAGGVGRYVVQEEADLAARGWDVVPFAVADEHARPTRWDRYFPRARDYATARWRAGALGDALSLVWNREAAALPGRAGARGPAPGRPSPQHLPPPVAVHPAGCCAATASPR